VAAMALKNDLYINVEPYTEVLGGLSFVLSISNGVVKLTGKTGTGKTAMCIELLKELKTEKIEFVHFPNAPESYAEVQAAIQEKLKLGATAKDQDSFIQLLTTHIIKKSLSMNKDWF
jgi:Cdc6-like AAA superfamily ATPase